MKLVSVWMAAGAVVFHAVTAKAEDTIPLTAITVTATRSEVPETRSPASTTIISDEALKRGGVSRIGDALATVPGVYMRGSAFDDTRPGNSVGTVNMRGIPGAARTLFMVDGIVFNGPLAGTLDYSLLPLEGLDRIEVVRGPYSALYGSQALGGVINFITKAPTKREVSGALTLGGPTPGTARGSFAYRDVFGDGFGLALDGTYTTSSGMRDEGATTSSSQTTLPAGVITPVTGVTAVPTSSGGTAYLLGDRGMRPWWAGNFGVRLYYDYSDTTKVSAGFRYAESFNGYGSPNSALTSASGQQVYNGWIRFFDGTQTRYSNLNSSTNPFLNFVPGGETMWQAYARGQTTIDDITIKSDVSYTFDNAWFISPTAASTVTQTANGLVLGGPGTLTPGNSNRVTGTVQAEKPLNSWNTLTLGLQAQRDSFSRDVGDLSNQKDARSLTGAVSYHSEGWASTLSAFAQDKVDITSRLTAYLGGRYDLWTTAGSTWQQKTAVQSTLTPFAVSYGARSQAAFTPKASLVYLPVDDITLRASVGQAFRTPDLLQMYSRSQTTLTSYTDAAPNLRPERVTSWEIGGEWRLPSSGTKLRATYFENYLTDFIYTQAVSATVNLRTNAAAAFSKGVELGLDQKMGEDWSISGGATFNTTRITDNPAVPLSVGKSLTFTPDWMVSGTLAYQSGPYSTSVTGRYMGKVYADDQNRDTAVGVSGFYDPYFLVDARASYDFGNGMKLSLIGKNLTDLQYYQFYLQPGRTIWLELAYRY